MKRISLLFSLLFIFSTSTFFSQNFGTFASAVWLTDCNTSNFFNTTGEGADLIGPPQNIFTDTNFGVFIQNSGTFILRGGEVKTFKNSNGNACSVRMNYRIYLESDTPGSFNTIDFPFFNDCNTAINEFPSGGPCGEGDQKWQRVIANGSTSPFSPVNLTAFAPGNYVLEVFYDVTGDLNSSSECDDTVFVNNNGDNFKAFFSIRANPTFTPSNPTTCSGTEGTITIGNLNPNSSYSFTYTDDGAVIGPTPITANNNGQFVITGLNAGNYTNFNFVINYCSTTINTLISLNDPTVNPPTSVGNQSECEDSPIQTLTAQATTNDGSIIVWYDAPVEGTIVTNPTLSSVGTIVYYAEALNTSSNCVSSTRTPVSLTINPAPLTPTGDAVQLICSDDTVIFTLADLIVNGINLQWYADEAMTIPLTANTPIVNNTTYYVTQTVDGCESNSTLAILALLNDQIVPEVMIVQPTCTSPTGSIEITNTISSRNVYSDLIISEITDEPISSLTYVELFNGTGNTLDLANYQIKVFNNGGTNLSCDLFLSGFIPHNTVKIISIGSNENQSNVVPDFVFAGCGGVNVVDNIRLTSNSDVLIDLWGRTNSEDFTSNNATDYTYRRLTTAVYPSTTYNPTDWVVINSQDYTVVSSSSYEFSIDNGTTFQSNPLFENLSPGTYTVILRDTITGCISQALIVVLNNPNGDIDPVFNFENTLSICSGDDVPVLPSVDNNGVNGTWNPSTIDNTQTNTYIFTPNDTQCFSTFTLTVTVNQQVTPIFNFGNTITICNGDSVPSLPSVDNNNISGTWNVSTINNTQSGTYIFTPDNNLCASEYTLSVTVNDVIIPVFNFENSISICTSAQAPLLPTIDNNGIAGSWNPSQIDNTNGGMYTFTPDINQCVNNFVLTVTIINLATPDFDFENTLTICSGDDVPVLPSVDNNGVNGTWNPSTIDNTQTNTYIFTPNDTQCFSTFTLTVTVNQQVTPIFNFGNTITICNGDTVPSLPSVDNNNISGTWNVSTINNTQSSTYIFTPDNNLCASEYTLSVTVNDVIIPVFNFENSISICTSAQAPLLPTIDNNGITGTWNPSAIDDTDGGIYTFTPDAGQCANTFILTVEIISFATPVFDFGNTLTICEGDAVPVLPNVDNNGVNGFWSPAAIDNTSDGTYTFIVNNSECAVNFTLTVTVNSQVTPIFNFGNTLTICNGDAVPSLTLVDNNNISGTWNVSTINNTQSGTYIFTPNANQCASSFTLTVNVNQNVVPTFSFGNALTICSGDAVPVLPNLSDNTISGNWNSTTVSNTNSAVYTFTPNSGQCSSIFQFTVTVNQPIIPTFNLAENICYNSPSVLLPTLSQNGITGTWNPASVNTLQTTQYLFTPSSGCATTTLTTISVLPEIAIDVTTACENNVFTIGAQLANNSDLIVTNYEWFNQNGQSVGLNAPTFNVTDYVRSTSETETFPLQFFIRITTADGCFVEQPITLNNIFCGIQKGISPNGDGANDYFDLELLNVEKLSIFNRYGIEVYQKNNYKTEWEGRSNDGKELPTGTYYYVIHFRSNEAKTGWIYINREN